VDGSDLQGLAEISLNLCEFETDCQYTKSALGFGGFA
jgi:hypothetical protein